MFYQTGRQRRRVRNRHSLRVVQVVNTLDVSDGGPARNSLELNIALNQHDQVQAQLLWMTGTVQDSVLAHHEQGELPLPFPGPMRVRGPVGEGRALSFRQALAQVRGADVVIVHGYYLWWVPLLVALCRSGGVPMLLTPHGSIRKEVRLGHKVKKTVWEILVGRWVQRSLTAVVTGSEEEASEVCQYFSGVPVLTAGVGTALPREYKRGDSVREPIRLLCVSRLAAVKRIDLAIGTVAELAGRGVSASLTIAGVGPEADTLRCLAEKLVGQEQVRFIGQVDGRAKHELFLNSDIFLMPSSKENFGIGLAEACAHGLPCVTTAGVAAARLLRPGAGVIVEDPSPDSLADAVSYLTAPERLAGAQVAARQTAEEAYGWPAVAARWIDALRRSVQ